MRTLGVSTLVLAGGLAVLPAAPAAALEVSADRPDQTPLASDPAAQMCKCGQMHGQKMPGGMMHGGMMHGQMMGKGGPGWYRKMRDHVKGHYWRGPEFTYHTGMALSGSTLATNPVGQYADIGHGRRFDFNDFFSLGATSHLAYQLFPQTGLGSWIVPYGGFVPRVGVTLGPVRFDLGATAGLGGMIRTAASDTLQARAMWILEPQAELSLRTDHMNVGLRAGYLMTPNMGDVGGLTVGLRIGHGGYYPAGKAPSVTPPEQGDGDDDGDEKNEMKGSEPEHKH